jgi:glucose-1-phosphate adenylyltransferase
VEDSLLLNGVVVGRDAVVRRAIIDKNVVIPDGFRIGVDEAADRQRFTVTDTGLVVIGKGDAIDPD